MTTRPEKLAPGALNVFWGSRFLTICEKVISYHDWLLDGEGPDGSYISCESMSLRLGEEYKPSTIAQARGHLKRLGLRVALRRREGRNLGWVVTMPAKFVPRSAREAAALVTVFDAYLRELETHPPPDSGETNGQPLPTPTASRHSDQRPAVGLEAAALGGGGEGGEGAPSSVFVRQAQLPPAVREKRVGAIAPNTEERANLEERGPRIEEFRRGIEEDVAAGRLSLAGARKLLTRVRL